MTKHRSYRLLSTLFAGALAVLALGCSSEPSVDELASNLCACEALSEPMTAAELAECRTQAASFLSQRTPACLDCLDSKLGDGASETSCVAADACGAQCGNDDGDGDDD